MAQMGVKHGSGSGPGRNALLRRGQPMTWTTSVPTPGGRRQNFFDQAENRPRTTKAILVATSGR